MAISPIILDRKIARLEKARDEVYCDAMKAYHEGPNWLLPKLESKVEEMNTELERLEAQRCNF